MSRELELQLAEMQARLEILEAQIELIKNPPPKEWLSPQEAEDYSKGKYLASQIITLLKNAIAHPGDYPFRLNAHYIYNDIKLENGNYRRLFRVNYFEFDRAMVAMLRRESGATAV